jgi:hypothetical protein
MNQKRSQTALSWVARGFAAVLTGIIAFYLVDSLAQNSHLAGAPVYGLVVGLLAGAIVLNRSAKLFPDEDTAFTPALAPAFKSNSNGAPSKSGGSSAKAAQRNIPAPAPTIPADGVLALTSQLKVEVKKEDDGSHTVTVTTIGLPNSRIKGKNGLFARINNNVKGVDWSDHKNLGEGSKQLQGKIKPNSDIARPLNDLLEIANKYK